MHSHAYLHMLHARQVIHFHTQTSTKIPSSPFILPIPSYSLSSLVLASAAHAQFGRRTRRFTSGPRNERQSRHFAMQKKPTHLRSSRVCYPENPEVWPRRPEVLPNDFGRSYECLPMISETKHYPISHASCTRTHEL